MNITFDWYFREPIPPIDETRMDRVLDLVTESQGLIGEVPGIDTAVLSGVPLRYYVKYGMYPASHHIDEYARHNIGINTQILNMDIEVLLSSIHELSHAYDVQTGLVEPNPPPLSFQNDITEVLAYARELWSIENLDLPWPSDDYYASTLKSQKHHLLSYYESAIKRGKVHVQKTVPDIENLIIIHIE